jgi:hypothetical protein|nr:MAG TPA: hypothetical protein [Caudoviricetes sp.]
MTALTMEQRRQDFEAMLKRADVARRAVSKSWTTEGGTPEKPLASLARDVAELCASWATNAKRAQTHHPSDQVKDLAILVAARCLQALNECESAPDRHDLLDWITARAKFWFEESEEEWLDMGVAPCDRVQSLIGALGRVAVFWPAAPCVINQLGEDEGTHVQFDTLVRLTFEAICAALAAERGLWQEES